MRWFCITNISVYEGQEVGNSCLTVEKRPAGLEGSRLGESKVTTDGESWSGVWACGPW